MSTSLYIHIPWCVKKCPYCDFNSHVSASNLPEAEYIDALIKDLKQDTEQYPTNQICSIFIGGGTPSLFSAKSYARLFDAIAKIFDLSTIEITLEANPGTTEQKHFADYRALGINRLSLGIQSFDDNQLKTLGRVHDSKAALQAIKHAQRYFNNINLDIMYGLPQQTITSGINDLTTAIQHNPQHISWYQLTIEPNTIFFKQQPRLPHTDAIYNLEIHGLNLLQTANYQQYEISAFCQNNHIAQHNLNYWLFGDYYGIGAGAHGKHTLNDKVYRTIKYRQPKDYLNPTYNFLTKTNCLSTQDLIFEFMLNATRLDAAIDYNLFTQSTGLPIIILQPKLLIAEQKGLITTTTTSWQISKLGRRFTNDLQEIFLESV